MECTGVPAQLRNIGTFAADENQKRLKPKIELIDAAGTGGTGEADHKIRDRAQA
jgi:hypothetical protein